MHSNNCTIYNFTNSDPLHMALSIIIPFIRENLLFMKLEFIEHRDDFAYEKLGSTVQRFRISLLRGNQIQSDIEYQVEKHFDIEQVYAMITQQ